MSLEFLKRLLNAPGPSSQEVVPARVWREEAATFADEVQTDIRGNSFAILNGGKPRVILTGHIDEIGVIVSYVDDEGFVSFAGVGGWDAQVLVGQRIRLLGKQGDVIGVIGKKPIHLMKKEEGPSTIDDLWIDIGVTSRAAALELIRIGTVGVIDANMYELPNGRIVSRSVDNRIGAYTVLEALRILSQERPMATVAAVATVQEEITMAGAHTAAFSFEPDVAIVVDVTHATDYPTANKKQAGEAKLGGGPAIASGSVNSPVVHQMLLDIADRDGIPYTLKVNSARSGTDGDVIHYARGGVAVGVVSIPNRYMHSPNEVIQMSDVEHAARLIASFVQSLTADTDLIPR
ncbi:MAG: M20/M25/M40 family metallo-hydrolase [Anaerolineaceae bacterium]|nr:M20/M25/M40 family metallo-hydrolase [Anaerolineaceae bacterium]